jgi:archaeosortase B (VPXXXP-CTERM-specific)
MKDRRENKQAAPHSGGSASAATARSRKPDGGGRFLLRFCSCALVLFLVLYFATDDETASLKRGVAFLVDGMLRAVGMRPTLEGATIRVPGFSVAVVDQCTALYESALLVAAIVAFPATTAERAAGIVLGIVTLSSLNLVRIASLVLVGAWFPDWFSAFHLYAWQATITVAVVAYWLGWIARVGART